MKVIAWLIGIVAALGSAGYMLLYVSLWQWNRALFSGMALTIVTVVLAVALILRRLARLESMLQQRSGGDRDPPGGEAFLHDLQATRPRYDHFAWLRDQHTHTSVFITMLLGGGAVISGFAWLVGRVAESTTTPHAEGQLTHRMRPLAYPEGGLVPSSEPGTDPATMLLRGPTVDATTSPGTATSR